MNMPLSPKSLETKETRARDSLFLLAEVTFEDPTKSTRSRCATFLLVE